MTSPLHLGLSVRIFFAISSIISIQICAILSLTPVRVCISLIDFADFPCFAAFNCSSTAFRVSWTVRGRPGYNHQQVIWVNNCKTAPDVMHDNHRQIPSPHLYRQHGSVDTYSLNWVRYEHNCQTVEDYQREVQADRCDICKAGALQRSRLIEGYPVSACTL